MTKATQTSTADPLDFKATDGEDATALLLPAVQMVREAAHPAKAEDSFDFRVPEKAEPMGLLLPAVQAAPMDQEPELGLNGMAAPATARPAEELTLNFEPIRSEPTDDGFIWGQGGGSIHDWRVHEFLVNRQSDKSGVVYGASHVDCR
ncbi:MAG: hypothetical protein AAF367_17330 [Pseudomonadota bacterium]